MADEMKKDGRGAGWRAARYRISSAQTNGSMRATLGRIRFGSAV
jgi:hypothetical protein